MEAKELGIKRIIVPKANSNEAAIVKELDIIAIDNIVELINEELRKYTVMLNENNIEVKFSLKEPVYVYADSNLVEQVLNNYISNGIKNIETVNKEKYIKVSVKMLENKIRVYVFNTGRNISEENMQKIWNRFYKEDSSRNREMGGTGIGLSLVKAIMNNYKNEYGVINKENGVEFYFDLNTLRR